MAHRPDEAGEQQLNLLNSAWDKTRQHWHDNMTRRFETDYQTPLRSESHSYLTAVRKLMELLQAADRDTEY